MCLFHIRFGILQSVERVNRFIFYFISFGGILYNAKIMEINMQISFHDITIYLKAFRIRIFILWFYCISLIYQIPPSSHLTLGNFKFVWIICHTFSIFLLLVYLISFSGLQVLFLFFLWPPKSHVSHPIQFNRMTLFSRFYLNSMMVSLWKSIDGILRQ